MNIAVDQGNSRIKIGFFEGNQLTEKIEQSSVDDIVSTIVNAGPEHVVIGTVGRDGNKLANILEEKIPIVRVNSTIPLPFFNKYQTPQTLGPDRIAIAAAAIDKFPQENCLAISMGTCITYNFIDKDSNFMGGAISPGIHMKLKALHNFTANLPLVEVVDFKGIYGQTTEDSILCGVLLGTLSEIDGMIENYLTKFADLKIIICGGDASFFETKLKASIFVNPDLVLFGLHKILQHNVSK